MTQELLYDKRGEIGWITFNRPQARNALTFAMYEGLAEICGRIGQTREVKALVITGAGDKAFAAGTDIAQFQEFKGGEDGIAYERKMDRILDAIERCTRARPSPPSPASAPAAGPRSRRSATSGSPPPTPSSAFPIARTLGNCLSMANYARLAALIGPQRIKEMIFLAKLIDGPTALSIGLVSELLPDAAALHARAEELARTRGRPCPDHPAGHQGGAAAPAGPDGRRRYRRSHQTGLR